jgi:outer membrane cobalamin receptor
MADSLPIYQLDSILVAAERPARITVTQRRLSRSELLQHNATSLAGALHQVPSVLVSTGYRNTADVRLRGAAAEDVLVLVDGNPINPGYYGKADLSLLSLSAVAAVDVVPGPASAAYGTNATGGVVNITTHSGRSESGGTLRARFGSGDLRDIELALGAKKAAWDYRVTLYDTRSHGFDLSSEFAPTSIEDGDRRDNADFTRTGIDAKVVFRQTPAGVITATSGYQWGEKGLPSDINSPRWWRMTGIRHYHGAVEIATSAAPSPQHIARSATLFYDAWEDRLIEFKDRLLDLSRVEWVSDLENWTAGVRSQWRADSLARWLSARWGASLKEQGLNKRPDQDEQWSSHHAWDGHVHGELESSFTSHLRLTSGIAVTAHDGERTGDLTHSVDPLCALRWSLRPEATLTASLAHSSRYPTLHQLYGETSGNPDLKPESAIRWELGCEATAHGLNRWPRSLSFYAVAFGNRMYDAIVRTGRLDRYENHEEAVTCGAELGLKAAWECYSLRADYAYIGLSTGDADVLMYVPDHKLSLAALWEPDQRWRADLSLLYAGTRRGMDRRERMQAYTLCDAKATCRLAHCVSLHLGVNNIFDVNYEEETGFPGPGLQMIAGVELTFY